MKINKNKTIGFLDLSLGVEGMISVFSYPYVLKLLKDASASLAGSAGADISFDPLVVYPLLSATFILSAANLYIGYKNFFKSNLPDDAAKGKYFKWGLLLMILISLVSFIFSAVLMAPLMNAISSSLDSINSLDLPL